MGAAPRAVGSEAARAAGRPACGEGLAAGAKQGTEVSEEAPESISSHVPVGWCLRTDFAKCIKPGLGYGSAESCVSNAAPCRRGRGAGRNGGRNGHHPTQKQVRHCQASGSFAPWGSPSRDPWGCAACVPSPELSVPGSGRSHPQASPVPPRLRRRGTHWGLSTARCNSSCQTRTPSFCGIPDFSGLRMGGNARASPGGAKRGSCRALPRSPARTSLCCACRAGSTAPLAPVRLYSSEKQFEPGWCSQTREYACSDCGARMAGLASGLAQPAAPCAVRHRPHQPHEHG